MMLEGKITRSHEVIGSILSSSIPLEEVVGDFMIQLRMSVKLVIQTSDMLEDRDDHSSYPMVIHVRLSCCRFYDAHGCLKSEQCLLRTTLKHYTHTCVLLHKVQEQSCDDQAFMYRVLFWFVYVLWLRC